MPKSAEFKQALFYLEVNVLCKTTALWPKARGVVSSGIQHRVWAGLSFVFGQGSLS